jgi:hypothetical protein
VSRWTTWARDAVDALGALGLDAVGVADGAPYQDVLPGCRSVLVIGSGRALWDAFVTDLRATPGHLADEAHPLDAFVHRAVDAADPTPPATRRWVRCAADQRERVDFRTLARDAGLGSPSALGLLLHPTLGPWFGLRAACFTVDELPVSRSVIDGSPCLDCRAPCAEACPAAAIALPYRPGVSGGIAIDTCARWNVEQDSCATSCRAREACPVGAGQRYSALEVQYHHNRRAGRRALAIDLQIADAREGIGPRWRDHV